MTPDQAMQLVAAVQDPAQLAQLSSSPVDPWKLTERFETRFATPIRQMAMQAYQADQQANLSGDQFLDAPAGQGGNAAFALQPEQKSPFAAAGLGAKGLQMMQHPQAAPMRMGGVATHLGGAPRAPIPAPYQPPIQPRTRTLGEVLQQGAF